MSNQPIKKVAILGGNRIPFARANTAYKKASNVQMFTAALDGLIERFKLENKRLGLVVGGAVLKHSRDWNMIRECILSTKLDHETPGFDIQQACDTGIQAVAIIAEKIALGEIEVGIAGGADTISDAPISVGEGLRRVLLDFNNAKTIGAKLAAIKNINFKKLIEAPSNSEPRTLLSMGEHQAITTVEWDIPRLDQDELALASHKNMAAAYAENFFEDLMSPYNGLKRDNNLRSDASLEALSKLKPVYGKKGANPTMTAGNSTPLTDGASVVLLSTEDWAKENGHEIQAYFTHAETSAVDFVHKKEGLLMAPVYAVPRLLKKAELSLQDFDYYEIHEAFASQVLSTLKAWEDEKFCQEHLGLEHALGAIDRSKLNVKGSSLAAGHPFSATGGRIVGVAAKLLKEKRAGRALISICAAGGQGVVAIIER